MAVKFTNNAKTTLASSLTNVATSASVVDGSVFPTLGAGEYFYCTFDDGSNNEIVKVTARSGNTLTIVRGVDNTTARAFSSGDAAELRATAGLLTDIQENIAAKSANQTVYNTTTASSATDYDIGIDPSVEANAMVFLNGVMQHHDTFSFSGSTLTFDTAPSDGMALEVIVDNLINLQSSNLTVDTFTAADVGGNPQTDFTLSDSPAAETNLIVFVDGVFQDQDAYTISSNVLTMTDGVIADRVVTVYVINPVNIGTPSDGTVTSAKLSGNITMPANLTVTGDVAFDSPTFVVDNANSRVGIGTAAPTTLLDIVGDVKMSAGLQVSGIDYPTSDGTNGQVLTTDGAGTLSFSTISGYTDSDVETYLDGGTSSPVLASLIVDTNTLYVDSTNNKLLSGTTTAPSGSSVNMLLAGTTAAGIQFSDTAGNGGAALVNISDALAFYTHSGAIGSETYTKHMTIASSGNVGIGTDNPTSSLHIERSTNASDRALYAANATTSTSVDYNKYGITGLAYGASGSWSRGIGVTGVVDATRFHKAIGVAGTLNTSEPTGFGFDSAIYGDGANVGYAGIFENGNVAIGNTGNDYTRLTVQNSTYAAGNRMLVISNGSQDLGASYDTVVINQYDVPTIRLIETQNDVQSTWSCGNENSNRTVIGSTGPLAFCTGRPADTAGYSVAGEAMFIKDTDQTVCINRTSTFGAANAAAMMVTGSGNSSCAYWTCPNTANYDIHVFFNGGLGVIGSIRQNSSLNGVAYNTSSDYRLKENVTYDWDATTRLKQLKPCRFNWISDETDTLEDGFLAHEVATAVPNAVTGEKDAMTAAVLYEETDQEVIDGEAQVGDIKEEEKINPQQLDHSKLVPLLVKTIQELEARITELENN